MREGFRDLLIWPSEEYNSPEVITIQNGFSDVAEVDDQDRISYYRVGN